MYSASAMSSVKTYRPRGVRSIRATVSGTEASWPVGLAEHGKDGTKGFGSKERVGEFQVCHDGGWDEKFGSLRQAGEDKFPFG